MNTLKEEEERRSSGEDKGAILVTYAIPPEKAVVDYLKETIPLTSLSDRKLQVPIIHGHPLFQEGISRESTDKLFPKLGVEWVQDTFKEYLGLNERTFKNSEEFISYLSKIKQEPDFRRMPSERFLDQFAKNKYFQEFSHIVISEVMIVGFSSGGPSGRLTAQWIFESVSSILQLLQHDLGILYPGAEVLLPESGTVNLETQDLGQPIWGFEISIRIVQARTIFRTKPAYLFPDTKRFDVRLKHSSTRLKGGFGLPENY